MLPALQARVAARRAETAKSIIEQLGTDLGADPDPMSLGRALHSTMASLLMMRLGDFLVDAWRQAVALGDGTRRTYGILLGVAGVNLKQARRPREFLDIAGEQPADWEAELSGYPRITLSVERSNALSLIGQPRLALEALLALAPENLNVLAPSPYRMWRRNIAMLRRQSGAPDAAIRDLGVLMSEVEADDERLDVLTAFSNAAQHVGNADLAGNLLAQALLLSADRPLARRALLLASMATTRASLGDPLPHGFGDLLTATSDPLVVVAMAEAVVSALSHGTHVDPTLLGQLQTELDAVEQKAETDQDRTVWFNALLVKAYLLEEIAPPRAADVWARLVELRGDELPRAIELAALAHYRFVQGAADQARALLRRLPQALDRELGETTDISMVVDTTGPLRARFRLLGDDVLAARPRNVGDIRLVAELRRDAVGQVMARARDGSSLEEVELISRSLALPRGHLWVLEWLDTSRGLLTLLTRFDSDGRSVVTTVPPMPHEPARVAEALKSRLDGWLRNNPADPLSLPAWMETEAWLNSVLADADVHDHIVVIEHESIRGLPWHALDNVPWTLSYAAGWTAIARARKIVRRPVRRLGFVSVAARDDSASVVDAFQNSRDLSERFATQHGLDLTLVTGPAGDSPAILDLLNSCDLVTLNCHGLLRRDAADLAFIVAANRALPPLAAAAIAASPQHQLSWRDLQSVKQAPQLVLSAACSTGTSLMAGLGERFGLHAVLRHAGTATVVAPAWDGVAEDVPEQLDRIRERVLAGDPPASAVKAVAEEARQSLPRWRARVLAVEGDWA